MVNFACSAALSHTVNDFRAYYTTRRDILEKMDDVAGEATCPHYTYFS